ncbi:MAG: GbsR/MarR family transcriptional regulator [Nitrososphaeria archaeon]
MTSNKVLKNCIELAGRILRRWGFAEKDIIIYTTLLFSNKPMSMQNISKETGLSLSTISISINSLMKSYLIKAERKERSRVFTAVPLFYEFFLNQPAEMLDKEVIPLKQNLIELKQTMPELNSKIDQILNDLSSMECVLNEMIKIKNNNKCIKKSNNL